MLLKKKKRSDFLSTHQTRKMKVLRSRLLCEVVLTLPPIVSKFLHNKYRLVKLRADCHDRGPVRARLLLCASFTCTSLLMLILTMRVPVLRIVALFYFYLFIYFSVLFISMPALTVFLHETQIKGGKVQRFLCPKTRRVIKNRCCLV